MIVLNVLDARRCVEYWKHFALPKYICMIFRVFLETLSVIAYNDTIMTLMPHKLMCLGKLKATHWALWPRGSGHYPLNLPNKVWAWALAAMDKCFGLIRPHQHGIANGHSAQWVAFSLPQHINLWGILVTRSHIPQAFHFHLLWHKRPLLPLITILMMIYRLGTPVGTWLWRGTF